MSYSDRFSQSFGNARKWAGEHPHETGAGVSLIICLILSILSMSFSAAVAVYSKNLDEKQYPTHATAIKRLSIGSTVCTILTMIFAAIAAGLLYWKSSSSSQ